MAEKRPEGKTRKSCGFLAQEKRREVKVETVNYAAPHRVLSQGRERTEWYLESGTKRVIGVGCFALICFLIWDK